MAVTEEIIRKRNLATQRRAENRMRKVFKMIENEVSVRGMEAAIRETVNYAKDAAPFTDRTHNLRASISQKILKGNEISPAKYSTDNLGEKETIARNDNSGVTGILFAGMEYGVYVEYMEHLWVLTGAMEAMKANMTGALKRAMKLKRSDMPL